MGLGKSRTDSKSWRGRVYIPTHVAVKLRHGWGTRTVVAVEGQQQQRQQPRQQQFPLGDDKQEKQLQPRKCKRLEHLNCVPAVFLLNAI
jgi:hypothetical protein